LETKEWLDSFVCRAYCWHSLVWKQLLGVASVSAPLTLRSTGRSAIKPRSAGDLHVGRLKGVVPLLNLGSSPCWSLCK
jgi:hypothetical protein